MDSIGGIHRQISDYYSGKIREYGTTAQGVDWNSEQSQCLRFNRLLQVAHQARDFSLNEIGCGYGALVDYLQRGPFIFEYYGVDLSEDMVAAAYGCHTSFSGAHFAVGDRPDRPRDFCVASGIFNVRLQTPVQDWSLLLLNTLDMMHEYGTEGFAFNALTSYSDTDKMRNDLYYANPLEMFDHCKRRYSRHVTLLHDYGLYEFTMLVRKNARS